MFPKVLILNQPFNNDAGGGVTLSNLFEGWPKDKLAVVCSGKLLEQNINTDLCERYYQLGYKEEEWKFPFNIFKRKYYSGKVNFNQGSNKTFIVSKSKIRVKFIVGYLFPFLDYIGLSDIISKKKLSKELCDWLSDFNPDIIYAQANDRGDIHFCALVHQFLKKPLAFHMMDDWPSSIMGLFRKYRQKTANNELQNLLNKAVLLIGISDYMAEEYQKRYGKQFITFHNPVDITSWGKFKKTDYRIITSPKILYAGRVGLGINESLKVIAKAIRQLNEDCNMSIEFIIQTKERPGWIKRSKFITHNPLIPYQELPKVLGKADILLLPYDFSKKAFKYIKYSMPTKITEYMASGTPIFLFAPDATAVVKYCQRFNCAKIVTENCEIKIIESLKTLISSERERKQIGINALEIVEARHNTVLIRNYFQDEIRKCIK